jgi:hypothetical protein
MTESGRRAATIVICLILPEKIRQAFGWRIHSTLGVKEEGGIDWQGEGLQSERPTHETFASASATF